MNPAEAKAVLEAAIFSSPEPISLDALCELLESDRETVEGLVFELRRDCQDRSRGIKLVKVAGGYAFATKEEFGGYIERLYQPVNRSGLSQAALEALAIIAYKQPVTRVEIDEIRGVRSDSAVNSLVERGLIEETGRREGPGRPIEYGTTTDFLKHFGLVSLSDLPLRVPLKEPESLLDFSGQDFADGSKSSSELYTPDPSEQPVSEEVAVTTEGEDPEVRSDEPVEDPV